MIKFNINKWAFFAVLFSLMVASASAQDHFSFNYLQREQGLSNISVRCIFQDSRGFMWFGTFDGLNRYDGYEFRVFRNKFNDAGSLPHNYINTISEDSRHRLWIGTPQGVSIYDGFSPAFQSISYLPYRSGKPEKITMNITAIQPDQNGNMFIATNSAGLLFKDSGKEQVEQIPFITKSGSVILNVNIQTLLIDAGQHIWVFIARYGLCRFDPKTRSMVQVDNTLHALTVNSMAGDKKGRIWLGSSEGLFRYETDGVQVANNPVKIFSDKLTGSNITGISADRDGNMWIATDNGLNILNPETGNVQQIVQSDSRSSLSNNSVTTIFIDRESRKWIGTLKGGVNVLDPAKNRFLSITHDPFHNNSLAFNSVSAFCEDSQGNLWVGTDGGGVSVWDADRKHFRNYRNIPGDNNSLSNNAITSIIQDHHGDLWIATFGGGVNRYNSSGRFERFKCIDPRNGKENNIVLRLFQDSGGVLWAATTYDDGKPYIFNRKANAFEVYSYQTGDLISLTEDSRGDLWAGNSDQLLKLDRQRKSFRSFDVGKPVRALYEDTHKRFWLGTEGGGLILFNRDDWKIAARYTEAEGLSNNAVFNILEDADHNLWMSTFNGITRFDPKAAVFRNFSLSDGLKGNQYSYRGAIKLHNGELAFGGSGGFDYFDPAQIHTRRYMPPVVITGLKINNRTLNDSSRVRFDKNSTINLLEIPFDEASISIQFAALEYSSPDKIQYAYYLEGWDKDWNQAGNQRTVAYNNIWEGHYRLRIKSTNAEGIWSTNETLLMITVFPPWYRTWWAYAFYLLLAGAAIYLYQRYRINQSRLKYEIIVSKLSEEKKVAELQVEKSEREKEHAQLERTRAEFEREKAERETERVISEKEKEIREKQLSFFTNISHELRTPLTLIMNPLRDLMKNLKAEDKEELSVMQRNAKRMLNLADRLLLFRKIEQGIDDLKLSRFDYIALCRELFYYFKQEAKSRNINYNLETSGDQLRITGDREKIEIIIHNLLSNAFKFTPPGEKIIFQVLEDAEQVRTIISDSGPGFSAGVGDRIFEGFYQGPGHAKPGFGIGLYMVGQLTRLHHGRISFSSIEGQGTSFLLELKKGGNHFEDRMILEDQHIETMPEEEKGVEEDVPDAQIIPDLGPMPELSTKKLILVVEDDADLRKYISRLFSKRCQVCEATNGLEGLQLAQEKEPDLVISDIMMPEMDGIEMCRILKEDQALSHIPVILLTAVTDEKIQLSGTESGADYYITKPFHNEIFKARVDGIFRNRDQLRQYFYDRVSHKDPVSRVPVEYRDFMDQCIQIIEKHLDDDRFTIEILSRELGMSHSLLYKKIKLVSGQSVNAFIRSLRLRKGAEMLLNSNKTITEVAYSVGFTDPRYFREQFSNLFKMNPSEYIRKYRSSMGQTLRVDRH